MTNSSSSKGVLYLIPTFIASSNITQVFPSNNIQLVKDLRYFVVENVKVFRAFLKQIDIPSPYDHLSIKELNKNLTDIELHEFGKPLLNGNDIGLLSDAGCPGIADPGNDLVRWAHKQDIVIKPLIGPSSIYLALMASGLNGQQFSFHGYLPIKQKELSTNLKQLESESLKSTGTHIFIEAPYRNERMFAALLKHLLPTTKLCVAAYITASNESIKTRTIAEWKSQKMDFLKEPVLFLFQA